MISKIYIMMVALWASYAYSARFIEFQTQDEDCSIPISLKGKNKAQITLTGRIDSLALVKSSAILDIQSKASGMRIYIVPDAEAFWVETVYGQEASGKFFVPRRKAGSNYCLVASLVERAVPPPVDSQDSILLPDPEQLPAPGQALVPRNTTQSAYAAVASSQSPSPQLKPVVRPSVPEPRYTEAEPSEVEREKAISRQEPFAEDAEVDADEPTYLSLTPWHPFIGIGGDVSMFASGNFSKEPEYEGSDQGDARLLDVSIETGFRFKPIEVTASLTYGIAEQAEDQDTMTLGSIMKRKLGLAYMIGDVNKFAGPAVSFGTVTFWGNDEFLDISTTYSGYIYDVGLKGNVVADDNIYFNLSLAYEHMQLNAVNEASDRLNSIYTGGFNLKLHIGYVI